MKLKDFINVRGSFGAIVYLGVPALLWFYSVQAVVSRGFLGSELPKSQVIEKLRTCIDKDIAQFPGDPIFILSHVRDGNREVRIAVRILESRIWLNFPFLYFIFPTAMIGLFSCYCTIQLVRWHIGWTSPPRKTEKFLCWLVYGGNLVSLIVHFGFPSLIRFASSVI